MSAAATPIETEGSLESTSPVQLLAEAWRERRSGCLRITRNAVEVRIPFSEGAPTGIETTPEKDAFAQTLEAARTLTAVQRAKVETFAAERDCSQASAVHALGLLDAKALYQAMRDTTRSQLSEIFDWRQGAFSWLPADADDKTPGKPIDVLKLIQQELPRRWGIDRLFDALLPYSDEVCELIPSGRRVTEKLASCGAMAQRMIVGLDGKTSIGRLLGLSSGDPLAASTLWVLLHSGLLRECSSRGLDGSQAIEFEVVVDGAPKTVRKSAMEASAERQTARTSANDAKAAALRDEVAGLLAGLAEMTHYQALGLEPDASGAEIKKAYFKAAKKFHPDVLARLHLDDIHEETEQVFARIAEAFETLSDRHKREAYDRGDVEATQIDTARLAQAETSFRKGEILLKMGNFRGALEYLEPAVELWPDEPAYQGALGWALFKQPQSNVERAKVHLTKAHQQEPENPRTLMRLGRVLGQLGETQEAANCIASARRLDPNATD
jgi:TolA-binding protein